MTTPKNKTFSSLIIGTALAFILGISFYSYFAHFSSLNIKSVSADDSEDGGGDNEDNNGGSDSGDDNENQSESESRKKQAESAREAAKKEAENQREASKRASELRSKSTAVSNSDSIQKDEDNGDNLDEEGPETDDNDSDNQGFEQDGGIKKDVIEKIREINRDAAKVAARISLLEIKGIDVSAYKASLQGILDDANQLGTKVASGDTTITEDSVNVIKKKLQALKRVVNVSLGDDENEDIGDNETEDVKGNAGDKAGEAVAKTYKNNVAQFVHELLAVSDREGGIGQQVKVVAQEQAQSQEKVESAVKKVESRGKAAKFFFGPDYKNLKSLQDEIDSNQNRIEVLKQIINNVQDQEAKSVLQDQIGVLEQENSQLQTFVASNNNQVSLFGWIFRLFR